MPASAHHPSPDWSLRQQIGVETGHCSHKSVCIRDAPLSIVTGANSGLGKEVTAGLMAAGHHVVMACRSQERCAAAKAELNGRALLGSCECVTLDLCDMASIRAFAAKVARIAPDSGVAADSDTQEATARQRGAGNSTRRKTQREISVLCNNAAVMGAPGSMLPNHFGPYLLTRLLLPRMAARGRVVNVASEAHRRGRLLLERNAGTGDLALAPEPAFWYAAYARTKAANLLFTAELSRRLTQRGSSVTAYGVSPGRVATSIFNGVLPTPLGFLHRPLEWATRAVFQSPAQGARMILHAALAPELEGKHVLYMHNCQPKATCAAVRDPALMQQLWQLSSEEVGLSEAEETSLWPLH